MIYRFNFEDGAYKADLDITAEVPQRGPSYDCGGTPAEPAEIDVLAVWSRNEDNTWTELKDFDSIAEYLCGDGYDDVMEQCADDYLDSMDDSTDRKRDRMLEDRYDR